MEKDQVIKEIQIVTSQKIIVATSTIIEISQAILKLNAQISPQTMEIVAIINKNPSTLTIAQLSSYDH